MVVMVVMNVKPWLKVSYFHGQFWKLIYHIKSYHIIYNQIGVQFSYLTKLLPSLGCQSSDWDKFQWLCWSVPPFRIRPKLLSCPASTAVSILLDIEYFAYKGSIFANRRYKACVLMSSQWHAAEAFVGNKKSWNMFLLGQHDDKEWRHFIRLCTRHFVGCT